MISSCARASETAASIASLSPRIEKAEIQDLAALEEAAFASASQRNHAVPENRFQI